MLRLTLQGLGALALAAQNASELPAGGILSLDKSLLINLGLQWMHTMILTVALVFILYKPVKKFMEQRTERVKNEIEAARAEREEVFELREKYEKLIADVEKERDEILLQAHKKAMEKSDQLLFDARREAEAMYNRAMSEVDVERKNVMDEMKRQMIDISMMAASRFVEVSIDRETQDRYIDEAFTDWEGS